MKVLIIGGGAISEMFHIPAAIKLFGIDQVFLAESDNKQIEKIKSKYKLKFVTENYLDFINQVEICILATPPHIHFEIIKKCLQFSKPVLCEKPITLTFSESKELIELQKKNNVLIALCHTYRFFPNRNYLRNQILSGFFGDNIIITIEEGEPASWKSVSGYNFRKELVPGGVLFDAGIHSLDFILWCLGEPISISYFDDSLGGLESNCQLILKFNNQSKAIFKLSRTHNFDNKIFVTGSLNQIEIDIFEMNSVIENKIEISSNISSKQLNWENIAEVQLTNFIEAIENPEIVKCDINSASKVIEVIEKCYALKKERTLPEIAPLPGELF